MDGDLLPTYQSSASDGVGDAYTSFTAGGGTTASGGSVGSHLKTYDGSSGTITFTVSQSISLNLGACTVPYTVNSGCSINVCLLADLDPFPDEIAHSDPVVFYHGTDRDTADRITSGMTLLALGSADFGKGFYTATNKRGTSPKGVSGDGLLLAETTAWRRVRNLRKKKPDGSLDLRWGVAEIKRAPIQYA